MSNKKSRGNKSRRSYKKFAIEALGGKCSTCGYNKCQAALDFHHKDPNKKNFQISKYKKREILLEELMKCELLCKNCHAEKHEKEKNIKISEKGKVVRKCKIHGDALFYIFKVKNKNNKYSCAKCMLERQKLARKNLKIELVSIMGGACQSCGYNRVLAALEFHHILGKEKQVSTIKNKIIALKEIKKCVLLCKNCHMFEHWGL